MKLFRKEQETLVKFFLLVFFVALLVVGVSSSYYIVDSNEAAVIIRLGQYEKTERAGLHFRFPFGIDQKVILKTDLIHTEEFGFRSPSAKRNSFPSKEDLEQEFLMLTGDLNVAEVKWVILYKISDPFKYLFAINDPVRTIRDISESIMRRVVGDRLVSDVLTTGRVEIASEAQKLMQELMDRYDMGVYLLGVKLQDVNPPEVVRSSFNEVNAAKQEQEKMINMAEKSYNKEIPKARGQAQQLIEKTTGEATAFLNRAKGDSEKWALVFRAYKESPQLTRKRLHLEAMEAILPQMRRIRVVDSRVKVILSDRDTTNVAKTIESQESEQPSKDKE